MGTYCGKGLETAKHQAAGSVVLLHFIQATSVESVKIRGYVAVSCFFLEPGGIVPIGHPLRRTRVLFAKQQQTRLWKPVPVKITIGVPDNPNAWID